MRDFVYIGLFLSISSLLCAQNDHLARNYLDQGEYEKAVKTYQQLIKQEPGNSTYFYGLVTAYQQMEDFDNAGKLLLQRQQQLPNNPNNYIEMGYNAALQQLQDKAREYYNKALQELKSNPDYTYSVARTFEKYSLLEEAAVAYKTGMSLSEEMKFELPLARIYGEQGKLEEMFNAYLDLINNEPELSYNLVREYDKYIVEDPSNPGNATLRKLLLQRIQKNQNVVYNEMLAWLFVQQKEFGKSFAQEKAIYRRNNGDLQRIIQLTVIAKTEGDLETSQELVSFIIAETTSKIVLLQAYQLLMEMKVETAKKSEHNAISKEFQELLERFGNGPDTILLQLDYANFLAFQMGKSSEAISLMENLSAKNLSGFDLAAVKMILADVLVLEEKFNQALIFYSQIQNLVKNDEISQEARFKVAKTSYYKGDFEWAKTQLDVLKASSTQLIANDAMELSLLIRDNSLEDSTQTALKLFARADLLAFQSNNEAAIAMFYKILEEHKGDKIEDEAWLRQAELFEENEEWSKAEASYLKILEFYPKDILADNATFLLAELYNKKLNDPVKAKKYYEQIIFNFPDSIYSVEARKNFRSLRGDNSETSVGSDEIK